MSATEKLMRTRTQSVNPRFKDIVQAFGPVNKFETIFGIFRFRVTNNELQMINGLMILLSTIIMIFHIAIFLFYIEFVDSFSVSKVITLIPEVTVFVGYLLTVIFNNFLYPEANVSIIFLLADLDIKLGITLNGDGYKKIRKELILSLAFVFLYNMLLTLWYSFSSNNSIIGLMWITFLYLIQEFDVLYFSLMIKLLNIRLAVINKLLENITHFKDHSIFVKNPAYNCSRNINKQSDNFNYVTYSSLRELSLAYDNIGKACMLINQVFNLQLFTGLITTIGTIIITMWTVLSSPQIQDVGYGLVVIVIWSISHLCFVLIMSLACETLLSTRKDTKRNVNELVMDYGLPARTRVRAKAFMRLIDAWPLRVYVYDMFTVDITINLKLLSVITTYLIILIQMSHSM